MPNAMAACQAAELPVHPATDLFPLLDESGLAELAGDISANGLLVPVWLYDDSKAGVVLLDGRNRVRACVRAGVDVVVQRYTGHDPIGFSISQNVKRRHLTAGQRAAVAHGALPLFEVEAAKRKAHGETAPGKHRDGGTLGADLPAASAKPKRAPRSRDRAAKAAGTSGRSVAQFKRLTEQAPDLAEKVKAGEMPLDRAERIVRDRVSEARRVAEAKAVAAVQPEPLIVDIRHGDFREVLADLKNVDAVITDPP